VPIVRPGVGMPAIANPLMRKTLLYLGPRVSERQVVDPETGQ